MYIVINTWPPLMVKPTLSFLTAISGNVALHILAQLGHLHLNLGSWIASFEFYNSAQVLCCHSHAHQLLKVTGSHLRLHSLQPYSLSKNIRVHLLQAMKSRLITLSPTSRKTQQPTSPHCLLQLGLQQCHISVWSQHHHSADFPARQEPDHQDCWL